MSAAPTYRLGRHPRRTDHPALLHADGSLAHTFHIEADRQEIATILRTQGLELHTDDSVTPAALEPSPTRRGVLAICAGAAFAIPAVILAAPAALAAANTDAALIAACAEYEQAEQRIGEIYCEQISDRQAKRRAEPLEARQDELLESMAQLRASTPAGIYARARALAAHNAGGEFSFDHPDTTAGRLLGNLMRDTAALAGEG